MDNRPRGRQKRVTGTGTVNKRGSGLHTGPVNPGGGRGQGSGGNFGQQSGGGRSYGGTRRKAGGIGCGSIILIIIALVVFGGGGGMTSLFNGGGDYSSLFGSDTFSSGMFNYSGTGTSTGGWSRTANVGKLDTSVADGARDKRTLIKGGGKDEVTILVYMCGTDLESRNGMATSDLQEMAAANISDKVNLLVYTGGCKGWKNKVVSSRTNQIYQVKNGGLKCLVSDAGSKSMVDPSTLAEYIQWGKKNFSANRMELIFWDHGGGSLTGFGYDEKLGRGGSMTLAGIDQALKAGGVKFDFIGFDACLMATVENALMLDDYADYLIASEETEPGVGWYYTNWLNRLSADTSMSTLETGKNIVDGFIDTCDSKCRGQKTTLSVIDLAELAATVPEELSDFAKDMTRSIKNKEYKTVSDARYGAREFAQSSGIDQIDLVHFADNLDSDAGEDLCKAILGAVKYNRTSSNMTNAYGLSIYFPYKKTSKVDTAVKTYKSIGMDDSYTRCIQQFASMEVGGQAAGGGSQAASPLGSLLGELGSSSFGSSASYSTSGADAISQLLGSMMGGQMNISGLTGSNTGFFSGKALDPDEIADYVAENQFDASKLVWTKNGDGQKVISLSEDQWSLVQDLCLSVYYDDGEGYVDLGLDNVFEFDEDGNLIGDTDGTWLAVNGQTVACYFDSLVDDGENYTISSHIPAMLNGVRVNLLVEFDNENPYGVITGAATVYEDDVTGTAAKNLTDLKTGDKLEFICDYYTYDGEYQDCYYLGDPMKVTDNMEISNVKLDKSRFLPMYRFTDIYQQVYWTDIF